MDLRISLLNATFAMIYIIHKILVLKTNAWRIKINERCKKPF